MAKAAKKVEAVEEIVDDIPFEAEGDDIDAELEAILGAAEEEVDQEVVAPESERSSDEIEAEAIGELEAEEAVAEALASSDSEPDDEVETVSEDEPKKRGRRISTSGMSLKEIIEAKLTAEDVEKVLSMIADDLTPESFVKEAEALPKKIREKMANVFVSVVSGHQLSVYTQDAVAYLKANGKASVSDLRAMYMEGNGVNHKGYSLGTAGAQSSQMMKLLPAISVAFREGNTLTFNDESPLAKHILKESAPAESASA